MKKITLFFTLIAFNFGFAQNGGDTCAAAVVVTAGSYTATTINDVTPGTGDGDSAWFSYTPTQDWTLEISVCADINDPDTNVVIFDGTCGVPNQVAADDDGCPGTFESLVTFNVTNGTTYYIQWDDAWSVAPFDWVITESAVVPPPANDDFANAQPIMCAENVTGDTTLATLDEDDAPDGFGADNDAPNVWYSYDSAAEGAGDITVDLCPSTYDTSVLIYTGTSGNLTIVAGNDDNAGVCGQCCQSNVTFTADGVQTYYICVEGFNVGSVGAYDLTVTCAAACSPTQTNQDCASANMGTTPLLIDGSPRTVDNTCSSPNPSTVSCETFSPINDIWYTFDVTVPLTDVSITANTTAGTATQANITAYSGTCGALTEIGCDDTGATGSTVNLSNLAVGTYYAQLWNSGVSEEGTFDVTLTDVTLSVGSEDLNAFEYFPNPVNDNLTLRSLSNIQYVAVYNMLGQEVMKMNPDTANAEVDMRNLSQGAYFVKVTINNVTDTIRIIKK